ncbi:metalloprotease PmbA [Acidithiobacillus sp.]|jgi:PmbA protein|uniref:metalloprotease PmbA n=1 Tax=Acidithiobacillus sp. TaxID=1872118 RepID=UPI0025C0CCC5|nr:metalloprotease PmbA [Acidithiobacillus sp.]MCK9188662.1 metalloprotease PmbA [Acidithiobacillus sp.]MCK9360578.1 metalloprotease PmbA [Acidithiobacillus sp.]
MSQAPHSTLDTSTLTQIVGDMLSLAREQGASAAEASASTGRGLSVTVRLGEVESIEYHQDKGLGVTVYLGQSKGSASTSDFSRKALSETVSAALTIARHTAADPFAGLADPELLAKEFPDLDLYHPWSIDADAAADLARRCEAAARDSDPRIHNSEGGSLGTGEGTSVYGNSLGFMGNSRSSRHSLSCSVIAEDSKGGMQRDYWYDVARAADALATPEAIGKIAAQRALRRLDARKVATSKAPVIFENQVASSLIGHLASAISGGSLYRKSSFLLDSLGKQLFPEHIRIYEEPLRRRGLGSSSFDGEGVATHNRDIIADGVLEGYILDSYSARKLNMQSTGNAGGAHNLTLQPGDASLEDLLREMGRGLLVTELIGFGINMVTGDYSRGAAGFWVEHGEIQYPVEEITIAGALQDMFQGMSAVGNDLLIHGNTGCPSILIDEMMIAGE